MFFDQMRFGYGHVVPNVIGPGETSKFGVLGTFVFSMGIWWGGSKTSKNAFFRVFRVLDPPGKCQKKAKFLSAKFKTRCEVPMEIVMQVLLLHFNQPLISRQKNDVFRRFSGGVRNPQKRVFSGFFGFRPPPPVFVKSGLPGVPMTVRRYITHSAPRLTLLYQEARSRYETGRTSACRYADTVAERLF